MFKKLNWYYVLLIIVVLCFGLTFSAGIFSCLDMEKISVAIGVSACIIALLGIAAVLYLKNNINPHEGECEYEIAEQEQKQPELEPETDLQ